MRKEVKDKPHIINIKDIKKRLSALISIHDDEIDIFIDGKKQADIFLKEKEIYFEGFYEIVFSDFKIKALISSISDYNATTDDRCLSLTFSVFGKPVLI